MSMNIFEFVKSKLSILDIISEYVTLKPAGRYWKGSSPFQHERVPSFTVSPHKEIYYCFSSGQGGDVINFIARIENCTQLEAVQYLIERYKIQVPNEIESNKTLDISKKTTYEKTCALFAQWCLLQLKKNQIVSDYAMSRGLTERTIEIFTIGYCPVSGPKLIQELLDLGYKQHILLQDFKEAQIIIENRQGLYLPFEDRIIFPIYNHLGACCGFGGRVFKNGDDRAKYYNSHEHDFFNKSQMLYGLHRAKKALQTSGHAFLVEGYMDCIAMVQAGYTNTIASLGTACTLDHLKQLARYVHKLYVIYDGDAAGQRAMARLTELCWQVHIELFVVKLPPQEDPASYLEKHGSLDVLIKKATDIFGFFIEHHGQHFFSKPLQEQLSIVSHLLSTIAQLNDQLQKDLLLHRMAGAYLMTYETLKQHMTSKKRVPIPIQSSAEPHLLEILPELEKKIFSVILNNETNLKIEPEIEAFLLKQLSPPLALLLDTYRTCGYQFAPFFNSLNESDQQLVSALTIKHTQDVSGAVLAKLLLEFRTRLWKKEVQEMKAKLASSGVSVEEKREILVTFQKLKKDMDKGNYE